MKPLDGALSKSLTVFAGPQQVLVVPRNGIPRRSRPGNFLYNDSHFLALQEKLRPNQRVLRLPEKLLKLFQQIPLLRHHMVSVCQYGVPDYLTTLRQKDLLLKSFTPSELRDFPADLSESELTGLTRGGLELKAVRAGDAEDSARNGKYVATPASFLFHGKSNKDFILAGQFPRGESLATSYLNSMGKARFIRTSPLQLFNLIRVSKTVTICPSTLHYYAALLGVEKQVFYPPIGFFTPGDLRSTGWELAIPPTWEAIVVDEAGSHLT